MKVSCPDGGSEMIKRSDDFDFETNFVGVSCAVCGQVITKGDVIDQGVDMVKKQVDDIIRSTFNKGPFRLKQINQFANFTCYVTGVDS
ncbi:hypothetical protein AIS07_20695 [Salmonella enterica]|nr:hypothetical protein [Salmonella enterica]